MQFYVRFSMVVMMALFHYSAVFADNITPFNNEFEFQYDKKIVYDHVIKTLKDRKVTTADYTYDNFSISTVYSPDCDNSKTKIILAIFKNKQNDSYQWFSLIVLPSNKLDNWIYIDHFESRKDIRDMIAKIKDQKLAATEFWGCP